MTDAPRIDAAAQVATEPPAAAASVQGGAP
jgi:hypothetical protein